jgi:AraC-like DNA-binding protein
MELSETVLTHAVVAPSARLRPFVRRFEIIETFSERVHTLLPQTSAIACFRLDGVARMHGASSSSALPAALFSGVQDRTRSMTHLRGSHVLLTVFTEAGAAAFLREPLDLLFNRTMPMDLFLRRSRLDEVREQLMEAGENAGRVDLVERFLLGRLRSETTDATPDPVTEAAAAHIRKRHGAVRMEEMARVMGLSLSALERRFRRRVGASPRKFASIVRMRHVLRLQRAGGSLTEIAHRAGYCDQSHFIKDFKSFTGLAPESFFRQTPFC